MVTDRYIDLRAGAFRYRDWDGSGKPIVLLHGAGWTGHQWNLLAPLLVQDAHVFALDLRGHGESPNLRADYDIDTAVADVREFIESLALDAPVLVGHSWGATIALRYSVPEPDGCAGIVLVDGGFMENSSVETWEERVQALKGPPLDGLKISDFLVGARALPDYAAIWSPEVAEILLGNFHILSDGTIRRRLRPENLMKIARLNYDHRPSDLFDHVRCPVLVVPAIDQPRDERAARWNEHRRSAVAIMQEGLSNVEVAWMEGCPHDVPLHRPNELAAAIRRFIRRYVNVEAAT